MKKLLIHTMALLLVPWYACQDNNATSTSNLTATPSSPTTFAEMVLPPAMDTMLPSGRHNTYLVSGRDKPGIFVERSDFPAGYIGMPHVHNEVLYFTVLKGSVYFALGEKLDTTQNLQLLGPGSFVVIPADKSHYEWFKEDCTLEIVGMGPQSTYFISQEKKSGTQ